MDPEQPVWCAKCYLRIAPYDLRTVFHHKDYHRHCFAKLVREQADAQNVERELVVSTPKWTRGHARTGS